MGSNMDKIYIVMNYVEHDLKSLMETMKQPFLPGTVCHSLLKFSELEKWPTQMAVAPLALGNAMCCFGMSCVPWN